jgi:uncharacterized protein YdhG (YjbR/CyaY superfamily)
MEKKRYHDMGNYISAFPEETAAILLKIRQLINQHVPGAQEVISYNLPAFKYKGTILDYFAAYKNHIGFYALPSGNEALKKVSWLITKPGEDLSNSLLINPSLMV